MDVSFLYMKSLTSNIKMYCNSDNLLYVPGFQLCELEEFVYVASTIQSITYIYFILCACFCHV